MFITKTWPTWVSRAGVAGVPTMPVASNSRCLAGSASSAKTSAGDAGTVTAA